MAALRHEQENTYDDVMTCPVCTNEYNDPRLLSCGHHFCLQCLEKIAQGQEDGSIPCPTCRHVTNEAVENLQKILLNEFQVKVELFMGKKRAKADKFCGFCEESVTAIWTCKECQLHMCDSCKQDHEPLEKVSGHRVTSISKEQFCLQHPENFVHCICETCDIFLCNRCVVKHDKLHSLADIKETAERAKDRLTNFAQYESSLQKDKILQEYVKTALAELKDNDEKMNKHIADIEDSISALQNKVRKVKEDKDLIYQKELKELQMLDHDLSGFIKTKEDLMQHVTELLDTGSDCEIINREKEFPKYVSDSARSVFNTFTVEIPKAEGISSIVDAIDSLENNLTLKTDDKFIITKEEPLQPMKVHATFNTCSGVVRGLAFDPNNDTYVVTTSDAEGLIQVFDTSGKNIKTISSKRDGIAKTGRIAVDTQRNLYLLPTPDGKIVTIDYEGKEKKVIDVARFRLVGISYCTLPEAGTDRYIVSSARYGDDTEEASHSIYIIDAEDGIVLNEIKRVSRSIAHPLGVSTFSTSKSSVRIVAGYFNGDVRIYDMNGKITNVIKGQQKLLKVWSVCCDISPGILVCGENKKDILYYCYEDGKYALDNPKVLFRMNDITEQEPAVLRFPEMMAFDWKRRRILLKCRGADDKVFVLQ